MNPGNKSFRLNLDEAALIDKIENKYSIKFETTRELIIFLIEKAIENSDPVEVEKIVEIPVEKIVEIEVEKSLPENCILMQCTPDEFTILEDIKDVCKIQNYAKDHKELYSKLISVCHKRGELVLTPGDYELLKQHRVNNE